MAERSDARARAAASRTAAPVDVAILLPTLYGVRNVLHSGLLRALTDAGVRAAILPRECPRESTEAVPAAVPCEPLQEPPRRHSDRGRSFLNGLIGEAFSRRHPEMSHALYRAWFRRNGSVADPLRTGLLEMLGRMTASDGMLALVLRAAEAHYRRAWDLEPIRRRLRELAPRLLWSTTSTSRFEMPYVLAARDLGIPTLCSILSFDNLTTRSALPVFDRYLVWSDAMKRELRSLYPAVADTDVEVTGTPQFDFHRRPGCRWSREATLRNLGLPAGARYFLYAGGHESLMPSEPELVAELAGRMSAAAALEDSWLVVRLHPQDDGRRWEALSASGSKMVLSPAVETQPDAEAWKRTRAEEQDRLISSLLHAEACVNIASTMSLDAAILDRPVIGIEFSGERSGPREIMYSAYGATHYRPIVESGGLELARSWQELLESLHLATTRPERLREARARMVREVCGPVDGQSGRRVVDSVVRILEEVGGSPASAQSA
ncbi:MAG TPA: hypothetical protein VGK26_09315 [Thermoanaerobaculia bacterium]|jgi:hypothetical protein